MSPIDPGTTPATSPAVSPATKPTLMWIQVPLSVAILIASTVSFATHWASEGIWLWGVLTGALAIVMLILVLRSARTRQNLRVRLADSDDKLRAAVASGTVGDEALRVSELSNASSEQSLSESIELGRVGDVNLSRAIAHGVEGDEKLRQSVAREIDTDARLQHAVESGLEGDANLTRAIAHGVEGDEKLRVSVAAGLVVDANLSRAVAQGIVGDEKLRASVAAGLKGQEALRVSVARGVEGAEALRVSLEQGLDAATTTLAVVDTVDAAITLYAPDGHILLTNDTARALAVLARTGELDPHEFGDDRVTLIPRFDQVLARAARGQLVTRRAYWVGTGDAQRAIMSTSQYVKRASGELIGTVVASHDVTPLARTRDEFLETVSHELRTPLTSMIGYLEIIEDSLDLDAAGITQEFEVIKRNTDRLLLLINDLLMTAHEDSPIDRRPVDVVAVAVNSANSLAQLATQLDVTLTVEAAQPIIAEIDANQIGDAIDKVLSNALKFNRLGGSVDLTFRTEANVVVISIADTGIGISDTDQKRIFERFYRAPSTRTDFVAGVGLGLSAAKLIIEAHHGTITATSAAGVGTTIEISLPIVAPVLV
jgi:signal transduction histidine kinase